MSKELSETAEKLELFLQHVQENRQNGKTKINTLLLEVVKQGMFTGDEHSRAFARAMRKFKKEYPEDTEQLVLGVFVAKEARLTMQKAFEIAAKHGAGSSLLIPIRKEATLLGIKEHLKTSIKNGNRIFQNHCKESRQLKKGDKGVLVRANRKVPHVLPSFVFINKHKKPLAKQELHNNDIRALDPCKNWTVLIDETGSRFNPTPQIKVTDDLGKFVAVILNTQCHGLKALPKDWHAVHDAKKKNQGKLNKVMQSVLNANVGVLGITAEATASTLGHRWADGVCLLIEWILRLLPVQENTIINIQVEEHGHYKANTDWEPAARLMLSNYTMAYPKRGALMDLSISVIKKNGSRYAGYADTIAHTWAGNTPYSKKRLLDSELRDTCLLEVDAKEMLRSIDAFNHGVGLTRSRWWKYIGLFGAESPSSISTHFLHYLGVESSQNEKFWNKFLEEVRYQMASGAVDLKHLGLAVDWLRRYQPAEESLPPVLRLMWLTIQLAYSNHLGHDKSSEVEKEFSELGDVLLDEVAPQICYADLHLSVARTNRFDFPGATKALQRWKQLPPMVVGLKYWGQIQSSLGQHQAFQGNSKQAIVFFEGAIAAFSKLSYESERKKEVAQTRCYLVMAMMDSGVYPKNEIVAMIELCIGGSMGDRAKILARSVSPLERYSHHLLLRYFVEKGNEQIALGYMDEQNRWKVGEGHPWALIQLYRALLLRRDDQDDEAVQYAIRAAELAFASDQGPVMQLIGACCRAILTRWGSPWPEKEEVLDQLENDLPYAETQIAYLRGWMASPEDEFVLLKRVLPFNFH